MAEEKQKELAEQLKEIEEAYRNFKNLVQQARKQGNYLIKEMHQKIEQVEVEKLLNKMKDNNSSNN